MASEREMNRIEAQLAAALARWQSMCVHPSAESTTVGGLSKQDRSILRGSVL